MEFLLTVVPQADEDAGDAGPWQATLSAELAELDDVAVGQVPDAPPEGAKGGGVLATLAQVPVDGIVALLGFVRAWVVRTGRTVEVSIDGDTIKISGASREQQDRVIEAWLVRHAPST